MVAPGRDRIETTVPFDLQPSFHFQATERQGEPPGRPGQLAGKSVAIARLFEKKRVDMRLVGVRDRWKRIDGREPDLKGRNRIENVRGVQHRLCSVAQQRIGASRVRGINRPRNNENLAALVERMSCRDE